MNQEMHATIDTLLRPIDADTPAGQDVEYELIYERIRQAREHDDASLSEGDWAFETKVADWPQVIALSREVLIEHSKHFQVTGWLVEGWVHKERFNGLAQGLMLLEGMTGQWWEHGFPALDEDGTGYRLAILERLDRDLSRCLQGEVMTGQEQCSLAWWQEVLRHEHLPQANDGSHEENPYSLESFGEWVAQNFTHERLHELAQQVTLCQAQLQAFEDTLAKRSGFPASVMMKKTLECLGNWQVLTQRMATWLPPAMSSNLEEQAQDPSEGNAPKGTEQAVYLGMTRERAIAQMLEIARHFQTHEPSSPVPLLMERAARWATMSLQEWLAEMVNDESCLKDINHVLKGPQA